MRHHHKRRAARLERRDGTGQCRVALLIQTGIGLVKHHKHRVTVQRTRQRGTLALAARQHGTVAPHRAVVTLWQRQNVVVQTHQARGLLDLGLVHHTKAGNVLGQSALEQLHTLGQITHMRAQLCLVPDKNIHAIEAHLTAPRRP